ncbi:pyridoxamine 5'-phosphate oxidase family protein [Mucilaginibacter xinganensis]|uniref:Pyridoxamine 5'-phosphate oxidase n=1 Tax=Mucilaginibacter xinganensis TaxID=1234841 RepID=A0A223NUM6_9SPHI|nr:pyridoxamine 5'-phosphate oxidase family protein [Mucilaginibacter xinganensis]ASU33599.1 Pyridoxamine 5'-phosphate oxidase [Mucilaginibacter xinganensis]
MLGKLNEKQIDEILAQQVTGRIGCNAEGVTYIVPVNYFYRDSVIYAQSTKGKKIMMMRKNPEVCFQVDDIKTIFSWRSVVAWGRFEEIKDSDQKQQVMQGLIHKLMPLADKPNNHPFHGITENERDIDTRKKLIVYKITLTTKTGRFEKS